MAKRRPILLLVDDDPRLLRALAKALRRGFTMLTATNVEQATRVLREFRVAAVLTDFELPDGTGADVMREAKVTSPHAVLALMSASEDVLRLPECRALAKLTVVKPFNAARVGSMLDVVVAVERFVRTGRDD